MRPKVLLVALLIAGAMIGAAVWFSGNFRPQTAVKAGRSALTQDVHPSSPASSPVRQQVNASTPTHHVGAPQPIDPDSVASILADLEKPNREVRKAALERAKGLDDRSIVPQLQEIADRADDPHDKADILDAIKFINLPSIIEDMAAARTAPTPANR